MMEMPFMKVYPLLVKAVKVIVQEEMEKWVYSLV